MKIKIIKTLDQYNEALKYLEELGDNPIFENEKDLIEEFELIEKLIRDYDNEHYQIKKGNPIEIIKLKMEYMNLKQKDLIPSIGSKGLVSDVLNKKRKLSKKMIRELSKLLNISQEILNTDYELAIKENNEFENGLIPKSEKNFDLPKMLRPKIDFFSNLISQRGYFLNISSI
jgi:HTH-type transcriptional regulator / antitoxin HigA